MTITADLLRKAEAERRRAASKERRATAQRDALVRAAVAEGWPQARIARTMGLTKQRVGQIMASPEGKALDRGWKSH